MKYLIEVCENTALNESGDLTKVYEYDVNNNRIKSDELKRDLSISKSYKTEYNTF